MKTATLCLSVLLCTIFCSKAVGNDPYPWRFEGIALEFREAPLDIIQEFLPPNPVIFEAGGHYGSDTIILSERWPEGRIISFEPNPHAFEKLLTLSKEKSNIFPYPLAVANFNGKGVFHICYGTYGSDPQFEGASSLLPAAEYMKIHYQGPKIMVNCVVLDDWCKSKQVDHIDFIWLDLEGMELQVLKSSPEILKNISVIYTETNLQKFRIGMTQYNELKEFLEKAGFRLLAHWYQENLQGNAIFIRDNQ